ncbi:gfo/Idh/MocA family oxidoreductase [Sphingobacterium sp. DK4209]|uniref:Gfo/Idh/MocA family oxidoreductase n=1 Tax=Sphingobacterium zhuxiongii TaxID=2662364 RepID=A0A5Q0Q9I7_9SPHI|nr:MULTISPECIES: Gfo/Idh/MocA family oxidoreductase [unclassified Sphingobacterium]MVZ66573.1 gfo/Idh/MocA family oxidoreductase [Sphingobacterium sp. DK4209]QGA26757.1 gfo/Idh/MocA family oxidoreductase [Sphingobacterium sp. dk4302]
MNDWSLNRREFILGSTALLGLSSLPQLLKGELPKSIKNVGLIGAGWYGKSDLFRLLQVADVEVLAVCDVDKRHLKEAAQLIAERQKSKNTPKTYADYRKMLSAHQFDLILIGTPDHWHALTAIAAMEAGAHVYLQKPISVDVMEGEALLATARKLNRKVQIGTQRRSTPHMIDAKENIVDKGLLGNISHVEMCCYYHMRNNENPDLKPIPDFLDYEMWTGPAPMRPYDHLPHGGWWRSFMEYGNGITGDMCVHMFDTVRWMLNLGWPTKIDAYGGIYVQKEGKSNIADTQTAVFQYEHLNCVWQHRTWGTAADPEFPWAFILYGDKGTLKGSTMKYEFIPLKGERIKKDVVLEKEAYPEDLKEARIEINAAPATRKHMQNLLKAIENDELPVADIEQGHISTASCILANISMKLGRPVEYDPKRKICLNDPEATQLLKRAYRGPWKHPYKSS